MRPRSICLPQPGYFLRSSLPAGGVVFRCVEGWIVMDAWLPAPAMRSDGGGGGVRVPSDAYRTLSCMGVIYRVLYSKPNSDYVHGYRGRAVMDGSYRSGPRDVRAGSEQFPIV
uniref:Uncharacterized protein n=1 Tax=Setaria viridis TaxID=4556 RepID=A0A4U6T492_SETVI|nr:hypothetical protein SEVIR_9G111800v2 [Setaria viridis]